MKLLVTGGAGFIGSNFVRYWVTNHPADTIVVLDKLTYAGRKENLADVGDKIELVIGDIGDVPLVMETMKGVDIVVHFAAESHVDRSIDEPSVFLTTNILGTHVLLEAARARGVRRFHHISTDEVFGHIPLESSLAFSEESPYAPRSPYAASKAASDHLVRAYHITHGLDITITNCSNNYGPYHHPEKFIPRAITTVLLGGKIPLYSPGNQVRDWLHVDDHCRAIEIILLKGRSGETYCVGGMTHDISNLEVAHKILALLHKPASDIELVADRPGHDVKYVVNWNKIRTELGWEPQHSFAEWLTVTVEWYRNNTDWWQPLRQESEIFYSQTAAKL